MGMMQRLLQVVYPPQCVSCGVPVEESGALCAPCWIETPFISGHICDSCGTPLPGSAEGDSPSICDSCQQDAPPWKRGRAAMLYRDNGRRLVLALKNGDRLETAPAAAKWLARAARPILADGMLVAPIPLHRTRLLRRRFNQSALLSAAFAAEVGLAHCPDLLVRDKATPKLDGKSRDARFDLLPGAIKAHPARKTRLSGRRVLLVDDVMTSGATFTAASMACLAAGATEVCVLALARVARDT